MTKERAKLAITNVARNAILTQVHATVDGKRFEYTRHAAGPWEVYDYPRSWKGVPRFLGHLPAETGIKLDGILARRDRALAA